MSIRITINKKKLCNPYYDGKREFNIVRCGILLNKWCISKFINSEDIQISPKFSSYVGAYRWLINDFNSSNLKKG
jgi:hypothetical protein